MAIEKEIKVSHGVFFITFTCHEWLSLIEQTRSYDLVYKWFDYLKSWGHYINGYAIMPNHFHALMAFRNTGRRINTFIGEGKRFLAYGIVNRLKQQGETRLLQRLNLAVGAADREKNQVHEIWKDSFDWKECWSNWFLEQKLNYIHKNPCKGRWMLAESPEEYPHCSARFYRLGKQAAYPVTHYKELNREELRMIRSEEDQWSGCMERY